MRGIHTRRMLAVVGATKQEQLPDLSGYLKFACHPAWLKIRLEGD